MAWWRVLLTLATSAAPLVAVVSGGGLVWAALAVAMANLATNIPIHLDMLRLFRREGITIAPVGFRIAIGNLGRSTIITLRDLLNQSRQQGLRLVLAPLLGVGSVTSFAAIRTASNIAQQALGTLTQPLEPELLRFAGRRKHDQLFMSLSLVWFAVIAAVCPILILLQAVAPVLFPLWTRGKVELDPVVFGMLSASVLVHAVSQPAVMIVRGNNLLGAQFTLSAISAATCLAGVVLLGGAFGLLGAGAALFAAECASLFGYSAVARRWLRDHEMNWPVRVYRVALAGVFGSCLALLAIAEFPAASQAIVVASFVWLSVVSIALWQSFPISARRLALEAVLSLRSGSPA